MPAEPAFTVALHNLPAGKKPVRDSLSAVVAEGDRLVVGSDETATVEVLQRKRSDVYEDDPASRIDLASLFELPLPAHAKNAEIDLEGLAGDGASLWVVGSHATVRRKPKLDDGPAAALKRLDKLETGPNRLLLGRIGEDGRAVRLPIERRDGGTGARWSNPLLGAVAQDPMLAAFVGLPAKENGFDVEGIAVAGERVFLGLRGPVLRGWAIVLELVLRSSGSVLALAAPLRKHFLDLGGLGIRDLCRMPGGETLVILAGPTMDLDGPVAVFAWPMPGERAAFSFTGREALASPMLLPFGADDDHAEGLALLDGKRLLVVYDAPSPSRYVGEGGVLADVFELPRHLRG